MLEHSFFGRIVKLSRISYVFSVNIEDNQVFPQASYTVLFYANLREERKQSIFPSKYFFKDLWEKDKTRHFCLQTSINNGP